MAFTTSVIVDLSGNLQRKAQRYSQALGRFSKSGQRNLRRLSSVANHTGHMLDRMGNRYTALLTGAGAVATGNKVVDDQRRFTRLGIQANKSAEEIAKLKKEIYKTAEAPDIRVDPSQITSAIEAIVEKTGDYDFARENIRNLGLAIQATGADGGAIGELVAEMQKMGKFKGPEEVIKAIDTLNLQGKEGAFTLQNMAALGPRVITAYSSAVKGARDGTQQLKEMGAALQVIRMGTGSSEQAATSFERLLAELQDVDKLKVLQNAGIQVFDPNQPGAEVMRPINEILLEILSKTKGRRTILGKLFGDESVRAFSALSPERIAKFMAVQGDGTTTMKDSARAAHDAAGAMQSLKTAWDKFADQSLTGPLQDAADLLNSISSETTGKVIKALVYGGAGALAIGKAYKFGSFLMGKRGGAAGAAGGLMGGMPLPLPVYVVNRHMSLSPDAWGGSPEGGKGRRGKLLKGKGGNLLRKTGGAAKNLALLYGAWETGQAIGTAINDNFISGTKVGDAIGEGLNRIAAFFGNEESKRAIARMDRYEKQAQGKVDVKVSVEADKNLKVRTRHARGDKHARVDVDSALNVGGAL